MDEITSAAYRQQCNELAQEAADEYGYDTEEARGWIWDTVDGHEWVIYTFYHFQVLQHSDNSGYTIENFGSDNLVDSNGQLNTMSLTFGALHADVMEAYERLEAPEQAEEVAS